MYLCMSLCFYLRAFNVQYDAVVFSMDCWTLMYQLSIIYIVIIYCTKVPVPVYSCVWSSPLMDICLPGIRIFILYTKDLLPIAFVYNVRADPLWNTFVLCKILMLEGTQRGKWRQGEVAGQRVTSPRLVPHNAGELWCRITFTHFDFATLTHDNIYFSLYFISVTNTFRIYKLIFLYFSHSSQRVFV